MVNYNTLFSYTIRVKLVHQKKKILQTSGLKKKFVHRKIFSPPLRLWGPSLSTRVVDALGGRFSFHYAAQNVSYFSFVRLFQLHVYLQFSYIRGFPI